MKKLYIITISALVFFIILISWESRAKILEDGLNALVKEDFKKTEKTIAKLKKKKSSPPSVFYQGYYYLAKGNYQTSNSKMQQALSLLPPLVPPKIIAEIFLTQAASSTFDGRQEEVPALVNMAISSSKTHPILPFFKTLCDYFKGNFEGAAKGFLNYQFPLEDDHRFWLSPILGNLFSRTWLEMHRAHALCECHEFEKAQEILEKELFLLPPSNVQDEMIGNLFLGLTYLKKGSSLPSAERATYLKMAVLTFDSLPFKEISKLQEKEIIIEDLQQEISQLLPFLLNDSILREPTFYAIKVLETWHVEKAIEQIAVALGDLLITTLENEREGHYAFCQAIKANFGEGEFHALLMEHCFRRFATYMKAKDTTSLQPMWHLVEALSANPERFTNRLANLMIAEIYRTISIDDENLTKTQMTLAFYKQIKNDADGQGELAKTLVYYAKLLWQREGQERKGTHLMDIALSLAPPGGDQSLHKEIEGFLTELYFLAEKANTVRRLALLHDTFIHFHIGRKNVVSPSKIANHLADGYYLFSTNQYPSAQINAEWILKLEPGNQEALKLHGLSCFHQGEYQKALCSLKKLDTPDPKVVKAMMLSEVFANTKTHDQLAQIDMIETFEKNEQ